eukprot:TRINITY_DN3827_c0_g2_i1.p1 TRINITY_DN3827_c0_g2~~TRINITY_DN3827_c0_g2_i1.p1  ORF type:complete len:541 (-),score=97.37 TRINITY_DN3827_c0_g2_i1:43-1665(-)
MGGHSLFLAVFAPTGWPQSVAPEYGRYQLWDTIQQVTFFVNTVISKQAVMKFHGVGDPSKTPAEAAALEMGRGLLATLCALLVATPSFLDLYRLLPRSFRMLAEMLNASGHFVEILAALFSRIVAFLYLGPVLCTLAGTMSGAVRSVILQHFARGGQLPPGSEPDFGDISLKESNQDKGGKIFGLFIGIGLLLGYIGVGSGNAAEQASLKRSLQWFLILSIIHVLGNVKAVLQLQIPDKAEKVLDEGRGKLETSPPAEPFLRRMFLPKGYPHTVVKCYARFRFWNLVNAMTGYPKQVVTSMLFWSNVYGVGNPSSTPEQAVLIDIFMMSVDCFVGLLTGLPFVTQGLDYSKTIWYLRAGALGRIAEMLQLAAALVPRRWFFLLIVVARTAAAFAGTSGSRVGGAIPNSLMRKECVDRKEIELIHINVAGSNQDRIVSFPSGMISIAFLYYLVFTSWKPSLEAKLLCYVALQGISFLSLLGCYQNLPPLPGDQSCSATASPLLGNRANPEDAQWEEKNDLDSEMANSYSGPAASLTRKISD